MKNPIGRKIAQRLQALNKTQTWLAEQLCVSDVAVARWIKNGHISIEYAAKVVTLLGIPLEELLGIADPSRSAQATQSSNLKHHVICVDDNELQIVLSLRKAPSDMRALATLNLFRSLASEQEKP
ncbi:MAG: XRE family transcriptional regulator [Cytophagaceae bacterium]|jgi:transcriptional regulator with XRE-family HTH domain|nr:MAG: XRE family transcriptional regulator [Cytophagaceae bacterium]